MLEQLVLDLVHVAVESQVEVLDVATVGVDTDTNVDAQLDPGELVNVGDLVGGLL